MHIIHNNLPKFVGVYDVDIIKFGYVPNLVHKTLILMCFREIIQYMSIPIYLMLVEQILDSDA
jgi:hypothetical protein